MGEEIEAISAGCGSEANREGRNKKTFVQTSNGQPRPVRGYARGQKTILGKWGYKHITWVSGVTSM